MNNKPEEKVKVSDNGGLASGSRNLCDDMWSSSNDESTCGFDRDAEGNRIWDSQVCTQINKHGPMHVAEYFYSHYLRVNTKRKFNK